MNALNVPLLDYMVETAGLGKGTRRERGRKRERDFCEL